MMAQSKGGSALLKTEDWLAVWLGFLIIILVLVFPGLRPEMPKFRWATDAGFAATVDEKKPAVDTLVKDAEAKGEKDVAAAAAALKAAGVKKLGADLGKLSGTAGQLVGKVFSGENIWNSIKLGIAFWILSTIGIILMGANVGMYILGFPIVYVLAWLSQFIAGNSTLNYWGLEYVIFALF